MFGEGLILQVEARYLLVELIHEVKRRATLVAASHKVSKVNVGLVSCRSGESLVEHRASVEGPDTPCPRDLLRLSVGIEDVRDLIGDLEEALTRTRASAM